MMGHPINAHLNAIYFLLKRYRIVVSRIVCNKCSASLQQMGIGLICTQRGLFPQTQIAYIDLELGAYST